MSRTKEAANPARLTSRRQLIAGAIGTGFALAVEPVTAATISTDGQGLEAGEVKIPTTLGEIPAYRALPADGTKKSKDGKFPLVLVVQEIFGVHEHIRDVCRRFAKLGYYAVAPELFIRQGDVTKLSGIDQIRPVVDKVPDAQVMLDLDATVAFATKTGKADPERLGITGFCWGGRTTWLYSAHQPKLKAGVAWYGRVVGD